MIIFFEKVNLTSQQIHSVYSGEIEMKHIFDLILQRLTHEQVYIEEYTSKSKNGDFKKETIENMLHISEKTDTYIRGRIYRESYVLIGKKNTITGDIERQPINTTESIDFYYDVCNEIIGHTTSNRFKQAMFSTVFTNLLNEAFSNESELYKFEVNKFTKGIDINNLYDELREIKSIQLLEFKFKPINPTSDLLEEMKKNAEEKMKEMEEGGIASRKTTYVANSKIGINIDSKSIREEIENASSLHSKVSLEKATGNGYVNITAKGENGVNRSTSSHRPIKCEINDLSEFIKACQDLIRIYR